MKVGETTLPCSTFVSAFSTVWFRDQNTGVSEVVSYFQVSKEQARHWILLFYRWIRMLLPRRLDFVTR